MYANDDCLWVFEEYVDRDRNMLLGRNDPYESAYDSAGDLFRACQAEHGRCVSSVYREVPAEGDGSPSIERIGWVFEKRVPYDDAPDETLLLETWVTVLHEAPVHHVVYRYVDLDKAA